MDKRAEKADKGRELYEWIQVLVWTVLIIVGIFTVCFRLVGVDGGSMRPTLQHGDLLLVSSPLWRGEYQQGDVVIACRKDFNEGLPVVKRVIATANQTVDIDFGSGSVYVDGYLLEENEEKWEDVPCYRLRLDTTAASGQKVVCTVWIDQQTLLPRYAEFSQDGAVVLSVTMTQFQCTVSENTPQQEE